MVSGQTFTADAKSAYSRATVLRDALVSNSKYIRLKKIFDANVVLTHARVLDVAFPTVK